jgi:hypothetical protein
LEVQTEKTRKNQKTQKKWKFPISSVSATGPREKGTSEP